MLTCDKSKVIATKLYLSIASSNPMFVPSEVNDLGRLVCFFTSFIGGVCITGAYVWA